MPSRLLQACIASFAIAIASLPATGQDAPQTLNLQLRSRTVVAQDQPAAVEFAPATWQGNKTAVIICDMWDAHHCLNAVRRELQLAPKVDAFVSEMRQKGALIIHAPSGCMAPYENHPGRRLAQEAPEAPSRPEGIDQWCYSIPAEEAGTYPIDQSDGGEDDDPEEHLRWHEQLASQGRNPKAPWLKQIDTISIKPGDAISDSGDEIWNLLESRNISNVMLVGVHTNMCVLGRPFGLRNLSQSGKQVVLVRDLTDTMYNPASWPYVSHFTGTDLIVRHIETYVCPTITSNQVLGGDEFRYRADRRPHLVCLLAEDEYQTAVTIPKWLEDSVSSDFRISYVFADPNDSQSLTGWECLAQADMLLISVRRKALPTAQLQAIKKAVQQGLPVVAIRTASHAFALRDQETPAGRAQWPEFDAEVLGGNYHLHHGNKGPEAPRTRIWATATGLESAWKDALPQEPLTVTSWLYKTEPLAPGTTPLLMGSVADRKPDEPVAWTYVNRFGGRVFYTSLGHPDDFETEFFPAMLERALYWAASLPVHNETP